MLSLGNTPNTRESIDTSLQSPNTKTSSFDNCSIDLPFPVSKNRSINRKGSSSHKFRSGPTAGEPSIEISLVVGSNKILISPGNPTTRFTNKDLLPILLVGFEFDLDFDFVFEGDDDDEVGRLALLELLPPSLIISCNANGGRNRTMSPRDVLPNTFGNFSTSNTSPFCNVGSILAEGIAYNDTKFLATNAAGMGEIANKRLNKTAAVSR
mmetsp:Transcript_20684/g.22141  ORF Transcript_20684/g.22141 Transcript_20684/m.22141 type:complete len:210 (+) Transcript_20684:322-951(+)